MSVSIVDLVNKLSHYYISIFYFFIRFSGNGQVIRCLDYQSVFTDAKKSVPNTTEWGFTAVVAVVEDLDINLILLVFITSLVGQSTREDGLP